MALSWNEKNDRAMQNYLLKYPGLDWKCLFRCYKCPLVRWSTRPQLFPNETRRIEFLFELYDRYTTGLLATKKGRKDREG